MSMKWNQCLGAVERNRERYGYPQMRQDRELLADVNRHAAKVAHRNRPRRWMRLPTLRRRGVR